MQITAKRIYCFIEQNESEITTILSATISLCLIRFYFSSKDTGSKNFDQLTKEEEKKLKEANRHISRALRLSKSKVAKEGGITQIIAKLRAGGITPITPKLLATQVAIMTVNAAKDGSIHALAIIIACKIHPKTENLIKTICLGGNTDALVNEIAKNLHTKRRTIITRLVMNNEIRKNVNNILLELELIKEPLSQLDLFRLAAYGITVFEIPIVKGAIIASRGITLMFITNKIKQVIVSQLSGEIAKGILVAILSMLSSGDGRPVCGWELTEIEKLKQGLISTSTFKKIITPEGSVTNNMLNPTFNDEIIDFIEIDPVVERLTGSPLFKNPLIHYSPKFNVDYVIERLVIGNDISKLPRDHITNLW